MRKYPFQHSTVVKLPTAFPTITMHTELNTCITEFQLNLPWICRKTALETAATNPGGQATLKTPRMHKRKFQGNRELGIKYHITDDTTLTDGSQSRAAISLNSNYQLCKQNIISIMQNLTTMQDEQQLKHSLASRTRNTSFSFVMTRLYQIHQPRNNKIHQYWIPLNQLFRHVAFLSRPIKITYPR
jgi:hypothetical protein